MGSESGCCGPGKYKKTCREGSCVKGGHVNVGEKRLKAKSSKGWAGGGKPTMAGEIKFVNYKNLCGGKPNLGWGIGGIHG